MIIQKNNKQYWVDSNQREFPLDKHKYLREEDYYEDRSVNKGRSTKYCEFCGDDIPIGIPHTMHHFYPEFTAYATHKECEEPFMLILRTDKDGKR